MANQTSLSRQIHLESFNRYLQEHPDTAPQQLFVDFLNLSEQHNQLQQDYKILRAEYEQHEASTTCLGAKW